MLQQDWVVWLLVVFATTYAVWVLKDSQTPLISDLRAWLQLPTDNPVVARLQILSECPECLAFWCALFFTVVTFLDGGFTVFAIAAARAAAWMYRTTQAFMEDYE